MKPWMVPVNPLVSSQEIRLSSPTDWRMRFVAGLFYEDRKVEANTDWLYKSVPECPAGTSSSPRTKLRTCSPWGLAGPQPKQMPWGE
jgi:hypothetical protein